MTRDQAMKLVAGRLMRVMAIEWPHWAAKALSTPEKMKAWCEYVADLLVEGGVDEHGFERGMTRLKAYAKGSDFPPGPSKFLGWCEGSQHPAHQPFLLDEPKNIAPPEVAMKYIEQLRRRVSLLGEKRRATNAKSGND
ncbi:MAG: hypothetical protein D6706_20135 [Chloroflexi bacterium]|nr:MAG: hypothetical protein D6706_20135 [Chloroflexota bacterium]